MATNIVCIDTTILSWFFRTSHDKSKDKEEQSDYLINFLEKEKYEVYIPTIVLAEILYSVPMDRAIDLQKEIVESFKTHPFDDLAAYYYREIALQKRNPAVDSPRWSRCADAKILATALSCGAKSIYSGDGRMGALASGLLDVLPLPPLPPRQARLPIPDVTEIQQ